MGRIEGSWSSIEKKRLRKKTQGPFDGSCGARMFSFPRIADDDDDDDTDMVLAVVAVVVLRLFSLNTFMHKLILYHSKSITLQVTDTHPTMGSSENHLLKNAK